LFAEIKLSGGNDEPDYAELSLAPVHDEDGRVASVSLTARDITRRKRAERHQQLLIAELNHRVKNTLAIVQSLAHQTFKRDNPPEQAIKAYESRLSALAVAHNLLTRENWEAAAIGDVVREALRPFYSGKACRFTGPDLRVPPRIAVSLTLALHELATNAQKYGALSVPEGIVDLRWEVTADKHLHLCWTEASGPLVHLPTSTGFGTRMLTRALASDLGGKVDLQFRPEGLVCHIRAPMAQADLV
jgi:two-component sensor histidine kinase